MRSLAYQLIRESRLRAGLSQAELAARTHRNQSSIARYESGAVEPDLRTLTDLCEACGYRLHIELTPVDHAERALIDDFTSLDPAARLRSATRHARLAAKAAHAR